MIIVNPIVPPESANNNSKPNPNWNKKKDDSADSLSYVFRSDLYDRMKELGSEDPLKDIERYQNRNK